MTITNQKLLNSAGALRDFSGLPMRGVITLRLKNILEAAQSQIDKVVEVQEEIFEDIDKDSDEEAVTAASEEWQEVLESEFTFDEEPIPASALESVNVTASTLLALDWLIAEPNAAAPEQPQRRRRGRPSA
jgi:uncharacterized protein HemX